MNPTHTAKHICNSHKPTLIPKIAKELVCLPSLLLPTPKQNQVCGNFGSLEVIMKGKREYPAGNNVYSA